MTPAEVQTTYTAKLAELRARQLARAEAGVRKLDAAREQVRALTEALKLQSARDEREVAALQAEAGAALLGQEVAEAPVRKVRKKAAEVAGE